MSAPGGALRSLRGRVALAATVAVAAVLAVVGAAAVASFARGERERVDEGLRSHPPRPVLRALGGPPRGHHGPWERHAPLFARPSVLSPRGEFVRLVAEGQVVRSVGAPSDLPAPEQPGLRTVTAGDARYRTLTRPLPGGGWLELGADLAVSRQRTRSVAGLLLALGAGGVLVAGWLSWVLAGLALRPLAGLREGAGRVSGTRDLSTRLPEGEAPREVNELSASINAMLARLQRSSTEREQALEATRRFAADAGHELRTPMTALRAHLGVLRRNPDLEAGQRAAALAGAEHDAERTVRMLDALQTLARGDAAPVLPRETVDLGAALEAAVDGARARHPVVGWELDQPDTEVRVTGWPDGLRALVDNLLENAARHGRPDGRVAVTLAVEGGSVVLTVDDDGPGISPHERERVFERFARGGAARADGSGLGLALVRQQARLHGGEVTVGEGALGGAGFRVTLPAARTDPT